MPSKAQKRLVVEIKLFLFDMYVIIKTICVLERNIHKLL